jgi:hypothetical protein
VRRKRPRLRHATQQQLARFVALELVLLEDRGELAFSNVRLQRPFIAAGARARKVPGESASGG